MDEHKVDMGSVWRRAWSDSEHFRETPVFFYGVEVIGAAIFAGLSFLLLPQNPTRFQNILFPIIGIIVGFAIVFLIIYMVNFTLAPYRQRNEARAQIMKLSQKDNILPHELLVKYQEEHLEGKWNESLQAFTSSGVIHYLESLKGHFMDINLDNRMYYWEYDEKEEITVEKIRGHLPDTDFWKQVNSFKEKSKQANEFFAELDNEILSRAESEVAKLQEKEPYDGPSITKDFAKKVTSQAIASYLGESSKAKYYWKTTSYLLLEIQHYYYQEYEGKEIARNIRVEDKHRAFITSYAKDMRIEVLSSVVTELRQIREIITSRINRCIDEREYAHNFCPFCHTDNEIIKPVTGK